MKTHRDKQTQRPEEMRKQPLNRQLLDQKCKGLACSCCGKPFGPDNEYILTPPCHPEAPVVAGYWDGTLTLTCVECGKVAMLVKVDD